MNNRTTINKSDQELNNLLVKIFQKGSQTYFWSSIFFPKKIFQKVAILYAFVRLFDDFVDRIPQDRAGFDRFEREYRKALTKTYDK